jgi:hypothetical protein
MQITIATTRKYELLTFVLMARLNYSLFQMRFLIK